MTKRKTTPAAPVKAASATASPKTKTSATAPSRRPKAPPQAATAPPAAAPGALGPVAPGGKIGLLIELLRRPDGATINEMSEATGWQTHSVRGAMAGQIKKILGLTITSDKPANERIYRIGRTATSPTEARSAGADRTATRRTAARRKAAK